MSAPVRVAVAVTLTALLQTACAGEPRGALAGGVESAPHTFEPSGSVPGGRSDEPSPWRSSTAERGSPPQGTGSTPTESGEPLPWGPTEAELAHARALVRSMSAAELAGQVIVGRWHGTDPATAAAMVERHHLAGVQLTADNIVDRAQVRATTAAVTESFNRTGRPFPPVVGVDEEGGLVAHLRGITADFPSFATAGEVVAQHGRAGRRLVRTALRAKAWELRDLGFTWVFAPVADVTTGGARAILGSRSASSEPEVVAGAVTAAVAGYAEGGVVSTTKHFPGLGAATQDSHETLPHVTVSRRTLALRDLPPFRAAVRAGASAVMVGHLDLNVLAPGVPTSLAPEAYALLRNELGFDGVAITDALGMRAVAFEERPAMKALAGGADLLLMPLHTARTHAVITGALRQGNLDRKRVEEAAARVVAVQLWQQRLSRERPLPPDVTQRGAAAARALVAAAS